MHIEFLMFSHSGIDKTLPADGLILPFPFIKFSVRCECTISIDHIFQTGAEDRVSTENKSSARIK